MTILGTTLGIIIVIFGVIVTIALIRWAIKFDFDEPLFKTEITITFKSKSEEEDREDEDKDKDNPKDNTKP